MSNTDQIDYWNGAAGDKWVLHASRLDAMLAPFAQAVLEAAKLKAGEGVLDVGCGGGALSLMAATQVGMTGRVTGVDVSAPLLKLAGERAADAGAPAQFQQADASQFTAPDPFDALISRFGVMFFADPAAAFTNLRKAIKPGGRLAFACWQSFAQNEWARAPLEAALPFLDAPPPAPQPGAPGPFAFAGTAHVETLLGKAGWSNIEVAPWAGKMTLPGDSAAEAAAFMMKLGPAARFVSEQGIDPALVQTALTERMAKTAGTDGRVSMQAGVWIVTAQA